jgi:hypothetical protein
MIAAAAAASVVEIAGNVKPIARFLHQMVVYAEAGYVRS